MATVHSTEPPIGLLDREPNLRPSLPFAAGANAVPFGFRIPVRPVRYAARKRVLDVLMSGLMMILLAPVFLLVALAVRLTSRGPILFCQPRVGEGGRIFTCYKFRSMCVDAEAKKQSLQHLNELSGPVFKIKNDPRMTRVGRFIRKFSLDELPQLYNVFRGDMSIVGPRPPVPHEVATYTARQCERLAVRPGLTCLWQVMGRNNIGFDHWVELDIAYIESMSFWLDCKIILKTLPAVITGRGAH